MASFVLQRLLGVVGVMLGVSVLIFAIVHILPGNVAYAILGEYATPTAVAALEAKLGLNDPLPLQYWRWLIGVIAHIADRIAVMYHGTLVEEGPAEALHPPYHPYTELLLSSVPLIGQHRPPPPRIERPPPAGGCKFTARCPRHLGPLCDTVPSPSRSAGPGHSILCHIPLPVLEAVPHWLANAEAVP